MINLPSDDAMDVAYEGLDAMRLALENAVREATAMIRSIDARTTCPGDERLADNIRSFRREVRAVLNGMEGYSVREGTYNN